MKDDHLKRGNLLWESSRMFLPEHKQALFERKERLKKISKPELDEQELEEIGIVVMDSLHHELDIVVTYWKDGFFEDIECVVDRVDTELKRIKLKVRDGYRYVDLDCLMGVVRV